MAELKPCIDCGHQVSANAQTCPKCGSFYFLGVDCFVCSRDGGPRVSIKKAHRHPHHFRQGHDNPQYYHIECVQRIVTIPDGTLCPECRTSLSQSLNWEDLCGDRISCKNCGAPVLTSPKVGSCKRCNLPILDFHKWEVFDRLDHFYHDSCFKVVRKQRDQLEEQRRRNKQCISCGRRLGFWDLLLKRETHRVHYAFDYD